MIALAWQNSCQILFGILCCIGISGCELPRGPMDFSPIREKVHHFGENVFGHQENLQLVEGEYGDSNCTGPAYNAENFDIASGSNCAPHERKLFRERTAPPAHAKPPLYSPTGLNPPWPKYLPVPTKPVFEPVDETIAP